MDLATRISRYLVGIVFIFSAFVKAVDPLGSAYKVQDYLSFMNIDFLTTLSLPIAILLITCEFLIGVFLLFNLFPRFTLWLVTVLMVIFTFETLYLAIANPIRDCGCFGDAVKLTNWQTFAKNIVLDSLIAILWAGRKYFIRDFDKKHFYYATIAVVLIIAFQIYNLLCLPVIDFRPYKVGTNIKQKILEHQNNNKYKTVLLYRNKKTGKIHRFNEDNYPWQDTVNWEYVDTKVFELQSDDQDYSDFVLIDSVGNDVTRQILQDTGKLCFIVIYKGHKPGQKQLSKLLNYCKRHTFDKIFILSNAPYQWTRKLESAYNVNYPALQIDGTTLKTIIRAKLGILTLNNGIIAKKINSNCLKK